jgi:NAD+ synthase (glutamine-hydrolysing)
VIDGGLYNGAAIVTAHGVHAVVLKQHLAGDGIHYEQRWFKPWASGCVTTWHGIPVGDCVISIHAGGEPIVLGVEICEDAWVSGRPGASLAMRGAEVIVNPSASHFAIHAEVSLRHGYVDDRSGHKESIRRSLVTDASRAYGCIYAYANVIGNEAGRVVYDGGHLVASCGTLLATAPILSMECLTVMPVDVDLRDVRSAQVASASRMVTHEAHRTDVAIYLNEADGHIPWLDGMVHPVLDAMTACDRALARCLYDVLRKTRTRGFVVSLSGGADSTAVVLAIWLMAHAIMDARHDKQANNFLHRFGMPESPNDLVHAMLTTIWQGTTHSSAETHAASKRVASAIGARHLEWWIDPLVNAYEALVGTALETSITWDGDPGMVVAKENIQARVRSPGAWMVANLQGKLLLSTSNRTEAACGYATMDGDTSGCYAPIGGLDKAFVRAWLKHHAMTDAPFIMDVVTQASSPELKPRNEHGVVTQVSEQELQADFRTLARIERCLVAKKWGPLAIVEHLMRYHVPEERAIASVVKVATLFVRNQWKRERLAPSFHLDIMDLDPRAWCRFPIISEAWAQEIAMLESRLQEKRVSQAVS